MGFVGGKRMKREKSNHHMGKYTGYVLVDGIYYIAPTYQDRFQEIEHKKYGIEQMVAMVTKHAADDLTALSKINNSIWDELRDDLGLDPNKKWLYINGTIKERE
jgi:hypothetical protein